MLTVSSSIFFHIIVVSGFELIFFVEAHVMVFWIFDESSVFSNDLCDNTLC